MKKNKQLILLVILGILAGAWMGRAYIRNFFTPAMKFGAVELAAVDDSRRMSINDEKGNVLIVSCFQTWCIDCVKETPELNQLAAKINSDKFKVIYISNESTDKISTFRERFSCENILFVQYAGSMGDLGIDAFPTTFLLDKKGKVIKAKLEGHNWMEEESLIRKLIAE